jgi:predicted ATP-dependent endonuclease of OLD family
MQVRSLRIDRFRGIEHLSLDLHARNVLVGPNNGGKSTILEALDLLLYSGLGRPRPAPTELDYFDRDVGAGFEVEAVLGDLSEETLGLAVGALEGWKASSGTVVPEVDGAGIETVIRAKVTGTDELEAVHEYAKPEMEGQRFGPRVRSTLGWVFDGRAREPSRQLAFYQGGLLDQLFRGVDLDPALALLREALAQGADSINADASVAAVLAGIGEDLASLGLMPRGQPDFEAGSVSNRELLQTLRLALPGPGAQAIPLARNGRGAQRLVLIAILLRLARAGAGNALVGGFEEPEEALEPLRQVQAAKMIRGIADAGGQIFISTHSPEIVRSFDSDDIVLVERTPGIRARRITFSSAARHGYERRLDMPLVRALFGRYPVMVEGVSDRSVFATFWDALVAGGRVKPAEELGLEFISAEGNSHLPMTVRVLSEAGKAVVAWLDFDDRKPADTIIDEALASCVVLYADSPTANNLERALAATIPIDTLALAMAAVASDRGDNWEAQRDDLVRRSDGLLTVEVKKAIGASASLQEALHLTSEPDTQALVAKCLGAKSAPAPFEIKGGRSARIFAETVVETSGVPGPFENIMVALEGWIDAGALPGMRLDMAPV